MKKLVRQTSALLAVALLSVLCAIPAAAAELSGKATGSFGYITPSNVFETKVGSTLSYSSLSEQSIPTSFYGAKIKAVGLGSLDLTDDSSFYTGAVGVYSAIISIAPLLTLSLAVLPLLLPDIKTTSARMVRVITWLR